MAEILPGTLALAGGGLRITWEALAGGDTGAWFNISPYRSMTVTAEGTVTTFALQGSNGAAGANPRTLEDEDGTAITAAGVYKVKEMPMSVRPSLTTGSAVTVTAVVRP